MFTEVKACRICGNTNLVPVLHLGTQTLTGIFPRSVDQPVTAGPLELVKCDGAGVCGLLQLHHSYTLSEMYGDNYGYRSGLNPSMVAHLRAKVDRIKQQVELAEGDVILDIGSNDGTTLRQYERDDCRLVGIDPTGEKFRKYYTGNVELVADFFSVKAFRSVFDTARAKVVTSFSMFYDLEDPAAFMAEVAEILAPDGIWVFEQSYMPSMLDTNSYDTVCHEHLEYYALAQIAWMAAKSGLEIVDVELNQINGGSFSVTVQKAGGLRRPAAAVAEVMLAEKARRLDDLSTYTAFRERVEASRVTLNEFLDDAKRAGRRVAALGASTKGNVVLQFCGIGPDRIEAVGEVNSDKFGGFTPGSHIPIVDEAEVLASKPDHIIVLPWHFRQFFEAQPRYAGVDLVYPLPTLSRR